MHREIGVEKEYSQRILWQSKAGKYLGPYVAFFGLNWMLRRMFNTPTPQIPKEA
jgi:hypothetical protein